MLLISGLSNSTQLGALQMCWSGCFPNAQQDDAGWSILGVAFLTHLEDATSEEP